VIGGGEKGRLALVLLGTRRLGAGGWDGGQGLAITWVWACVLA
jgi:hypothetical protein